MAAGITIPRPQGGFVVLQTRDGGVFDFGAGFHGSLPGIGVEGPAVGLTWTPDGGGYWILDARGDVHPFGNAVDHGGVNEGPLVEHFGNRVPVGLVASPDFTYDVVGQDLSGDGSPFDAYHLPA